MGEGEIMGANELRRKQIRSGIAWNVANLFVNKGLAIASRLVLARLLVPEHFGLVAMVVVSLELVKIFVDFGLASAIIQRSRDANSVVRIDSAFWVILIWGLALTLIYMNLVVPLIIFINQEPRLAEIANLMAVTILIHGLGVIPEVRITRRMRFKQLVLAETISTLFASIIAVFLAYTGAGVMALALQHILTASIRTGMFWWYARWYPRCRLSWGSLSDVFKFSTWVVGNKILFYIRMNLDKILVGVFLGAATLGVYAIAAAIVDAARAALSSILTKVLFPAFSRMKEDSSALRSAYLGSVNLMALVTMPSTLLIFIYADLFVDIVGSNWSEAVPILKILSFTFLIYGVSGPAPEILQAVGSVRSIFYITGFSTIFVLAPLLVASSTMFGLREVAASIVVNALVIRILVQRKVALELSLDTSSVLKASLPEMILFAILLFSWDSFGFHIHQSFWVFAIVFAYLTAYIIRRALSRKSEV